ncbi:hypothetical protein FOS14_19600 [Skermania sp. ID1734]|uniref:hypothetical protein n=1 Tax=Skermania sp. ID1734 TaxID=2597516 RepID=UPI00118121C5|nr:hypothetical protein [Skermania sp. ID1734]TSD94849.1 hypothetical protein FOS14_19600 [Skermania sp. ID1734]
MTRRAPNDAATAARVHVLHDVRSPVQPPSTAILELALFVQGRTVLAYRAAVYAQQSGDRAKRTKVVWASG